MMPISDMVGIGVVAAAISLVSSILIVSSQKWHDKYSLDHDLSGIQKFHTTAVPRIGGIAVAIGIIFALAFLAFANPILSKTVQTMDSFKLLLAGCPIFLAGTVEDITKNVSVTIRLGASILSALLAIWLIDATIDELDIFGLDTLLKITPVAIVITAIVVAGGINAINIIDGFHGLATTAVIIMLTTLGFLAWQCNDAFVTQLALVGAGAAFGFLLVNYPTGRLFAGDGGAYLLGFWVSEIAVLLLIRNPAINSWQVLAVCSYPIIEVLFSIYRRKIVRKANVGQADRLHLHTLIYRRLTCQLITYHHNKPWIRNAAVACLVGAWMIGASLAAVLVGDSIPGAATVVLAQVLLYIATYVRLVRGRWRSIQAVTINLPTAAGAE